LGPQGRHGRGVGGPALEAPFTAGRSGTGHLNWDPDELADVATTAMRRGWKIGTRAGAAGDRATRTALDVYARVLHGAPGLSSGTLDLVHALLATREQRALAVRLGGVSITIQQPLLYAQGPQIVHLWGRERARSALPARAWLDEGAQLSAGSDYPAAGYDPLRSIWGLVARGAQSVGTLGLELAVDQYTAWWLYTAAGAELSGETQRRGTLQLRRLADVVAFRAAPVTALSDAILPLRPVFTLVGGQVVYDPDHRLATQAS